MHTEKRQRLKLEFGDLELFNLFLDGVGKVILMKPIAKTKELVIPTKRKYFLCVCVLFSLFLFLSPPIFPSLSLP